MQNVIFTFLAAVLAIIPERPVAAPAYGEAPAYQSLPAVASDGENVLAVWRDERSLNGVLREFYAARISRTGELLDPTGIRIASAGWTPVVAFAGDAWSIFWNYSDQLSVARVSRDGEVIEQRVIKDKFNNPFSYVAASNGSRIVLAARDHYLLFDDRAQLLERIPIPVAPGTESLGWQPSVQSNGSTFLLTWGNSSSDFTTRAMTLDASGHPSSAARPIGGPFGFLQKLASDGRDYLLVTSSGKSATAVPISAAGESGDPQSFPLSQIGGVGWNGSHYLVIARRALSGGWPQEVDAIRLDRLGKPVDNAPGKVAGMFEMGGMAIAEAGGTVIAISEGRKNFEDVNDIHAHVFEGLTVTKELVASRSAAAQTHPSIASSGSTHLVVWRENDVWFMNHFSADGAPRFPAGVPLPGKASFYSGNAGVVFDGTNFVVLGELFGPGAGTYAVRVAPGTGAILDPDGVKLSAEGFMGAGTGAGALVVTGGFSGLRATRLDASLAVVATGVAASGTEGPFTEASVAWNGSDWLIAFAKSFSTISPHISGSDVRAVRLSRDLIPLDPAPVDITPTQVWTYLPQAASDGDGFVVFWSENGIAKGRRIGRDGMLGAEPVVVAGDPVYDALWDGRQYALAVAGVTARVTHVTADLRPLGDVQLLAPAGSEGGQPQLARFAGRLIAAYVRRGLEPIYGGVPRTFIRTPMPLRMRAAGR